MNTLSSIILAGGNSTRLNANVPKQFIEICKKPMLQYTIDAFNKSLTDEMIIVLPEKYIDFKFNIEKPYKIVEGGKNRLESIKNALNTIESQYVIVHDGDRPNINPNDINNLYEEFKSSNLQGGIYILPTYDSILTSNLKYINRDTVLHIQTPTIGNTNVAKELISKDGKSWNNLGELYIETNPDKQLFTKIGSPRFQKITIKEDLEIFKQIVNGK